MNATITSRQNACNEKGENIIRIVQSLIQLFCFISLDHTIAFASRGSLSNLAKPITFPNKKPHDMTKKAQKKFGAFGFAQPTPGPKNKSLSKKSVTHPLGVHSGKQWYSLDFYWLNSGKHWPLIFGYKKEIWLIWFEHTRGKQWMMGGEVKRLFILTTSPQRKT